MREDKLLKQIEDMGILAKGKAELIKHLNGQRLTPRQAGLAKCYECMGYFIDGKEDCYIPTCPLYPYMAYGSKPYTKRPAKGRFKKGVLRSGDTIQATASK